MVNMASALSDGDCSDVVNALVDPAIERIDLLDYNISYYDYAHANAEDDFLSLAEKMTQAEVIIFATPVYWYSMSAQLKTFFDRFTDLITIRKDLGRKLKGKKCFVICCGSSVDMPPGFSEPFRATCDYMDMEYQDAYYISTSGKSDKVTLTTTAQAFNARLNEARAAA